MALIKNTKINVIMNFKLQDSMGYTEVFEANPNQLKSINLTTAFLKLLILTRVRVSE